jgi:hypothetical protein
MKPSVVETPSRSSPSSTPTWSGAAGGDCRGSGGRRLPDTAPARPVRFSNGRSPRDESRVIPTTASMTSSGAATVSSSPSPGPTRTGDAITVRTPSRSETGRSPTCRTSRATRERGPRSGFAPRSRRPHGDRTDHTAVRPRRRRRLVTFEAGSSLPITYVRRGYNVRLRAGRRYLPEYRRNAGRGRRTRASAPRR